MEMNNNREEVNSNKWLIDLKRTFEKSMVGQTQYQKALIETIHKQMLGIISPLMVIGPTGCGKTHLMQILKSSNVFSHREYTVMLTNVSRLTEEGVKGPDIEDIIKEFAQICKKDGNKELRGAIYLDEIDKLMGQHTLIGSDGNEKDGNIIVQHQLMSLLDGSEIGGISTKNILFVFGGAFYQLDKIRKREIRPIGFEVNENVKGALLENSSIRDELIRIGFQREFLGRIGQIVVLEELNRIELKTILIHPSKGVLAQFGNALKHDGILFDVKESAVDEIIDAVIKEHLGARSVKNIVEKLLCGTWYDCLEGGYNCITIDDKAIKTGKATLSKIQDEMQKMS